MNIATALSHRAPAVAGTFFPAQPVPLADAVNAAVSATADQIRGTPRAIISPHAGYRFCANIIAAAWRTTATAAPDRIVILSPSHRHRFRGIALPREAVFAMPGFEVALDAPACDALRAEGLATVDNAAHDSEHGIETQLPFLNRYHPGVPVVPLVIGEAEVIRVAAVIDFLAAFNGGSTLFVLSSDLSHFLPRAKAEQHDADTARMIELANWSQLTGRHACGHRAIAGFLASDVGAGLRGLRLEMGNSSIAHGDAERTVGYGAWAMCPPNEDCLSPRSKAELLRVARSGLRSYLRKGRHPRVDVGSFPSPMRSHAATFVTLQKDGRLRGCIGSLAAHKPMIADVVDNAIKAGRSDARFRPVQAGELEDIDLKIAVLSAARGMTFADQADLEAQLSPGCDGLILSSGTHRGTFLPMVWDSLRDPHAFVEGLKVKAGLPKGYWSDDLRVERFHTESFAEGDILR